MINIYCLTDKNLRLLFLAGSSRKTDYLTDSVTKEALSHSRDFRFEIKTFIYALTFYFLVLGNRLVYSSDLVKLRTVGVNGMFVMKFKLKDKGGLQNSIIPNYAI